MEIREEIRMGQCSECGAQERVGRQLEGHRELVQCPVCGRCRIVDTTKMEDKEDEKA